MPAILKALSHRVTLLLHHLACGFSGACAFGITGYALNLVDLKTTLDFGLPLDQAQIGAFATVFVIFMVLDWAMRPITGRPGSF